MKTLIVVSGGDAPGINTALAHYAARAESHGVAVWGALGGLPALVNHQWRQIRLADVLPFSALSGSLLPSSRDPILRDVHAQESARQTLSREGIDSVLLFGGDGTLRHVLPLVMGWGIPCVAVPTTIDNDVVGTEYTLGFDSACNYAYQAIDGITATATALGGRLFMVETLGGNTGYLALAIAQGGGAHAVLVPEYAYDDAWLTARLQRAAESLGYALLVLSEGVAQARTLADTLPARVGIRVRDVRLGHAQRGGTPTHKDRVFARVAADIAFESLRDGHSGVIVQQGGQIVRVPTLPQSERAAPDRALYLHINGLTE